MGEKYVEEGLALARTPSAWVGGTALRVREVCLWSLCGPILSVLFPWVVSVPSDGK